MKCPNINSSEWISLVKHHGGDKIKAYNEWNKNEDKSLFDTALEEEEKFFKDGGRVYFKGENILDVVAYQTDKYTPENKADYFYTQQNLMKTETINFYNSITQQHEDFTYNSLVEHLSYLDTRGDKVEALLQEIVKKNGDVNGNQAAQFGLTNDDFMNVMDLYNYGSSQGMFNYQDSDIIKRDGIIKLDIELRDGNFLGLAEKISEYVEHNDGTVSLASYKSLPTNDITIGNILKEYSDQNLKLTLQEQAKFRAVLQAFLVKVNRPDVKFKNVDVLQLPKEGEENLGKIDALRGLKTYLPILQQYFEKNTDGYIPEDVFDYRTYVASNEKLDQKKQDIIKANKGKSKAEIFELVERSILDDIDYKKRLILKATDDQLIEEYNQEMSELIEMLDEHKRGYSSIRTGEYAKSMDAFSATFNNKYRASNPLVRLFIDIWNRGQASLTKAGTMLNKEFKTFLDPVSPHGKFSKADYKETFNWFWNGSDMITYKQKDQWNKLTEDQRRYLDYTRWTMRFELFKTMNPSVGYRFIMKELEERSDYTLDKSILQDQLAVLDEYITYNPVNNYRSSFNKFEDFFEYYEGWIPKIPKSDEEKSWKEFLQFEDSFVLNAEEQQELESKKLNKRLEHNGYPLRYLGNEKDMEKFTYNPNIIFARFTQNLLKKQHLDDAINVGDGIIKYLQMEDIKNNTAFFSQVVRFMKNLMDSSIMQKSTVTELPRYTRTTIDEEGKAVTKTYSLDKAARSAKNYVSFVAMAYQPFSAVRRGISATLNYAMHGISNQLASVLGVEVDFNPASGASSWLSALNLGTKDMKQKAKLMSQVFGNLPEGYDGVGRRQRGFIKRADPWLYKTLQDWGFNIDRFFDNTNYNAVMIAQLKAMKLSDGKSMWDHYTVVDGELVYTGPVRGYDSVTNEEIKGLTYKEINKLKALSAKMYGYYRDEERVGAEISTLGTLGMQFKKFALPIYMSAIGKPYSSEALGKYVSVGKDVEGNEMLEWQDRYEEGFMVSIYKALNILGLIQNPVNVLKGQGRKLDFTVWQQLNNEQKRNIVYAMVKLGTFLVLMKMIQLATGDADDDDTNKVKSFMNLIKRETMTELDVYNGLRTISNVPTFDKMRELTSGIDGLLIDSMVYGERIESGTFRNGYFGETIPAYKGIPQVMKNVPVTSSVWSLYRQYIDYDKFAEEMDQLSTR